MAHDSDARRFDRSNEFKGFRNISASFDTLGRLFCSSWVLQHRDTWYHVWRQCRWAPCDGAHLSVFSCRKKISCFSVLHTIVHQLRLVYAKTYSMYQLAIFMVFEQCSVIRKRTTCLSQWGESSNMFNCPCHYYNPHCCRHHHRRRLDHHHHDNNRHR